MAKFCPLMSNGSETVQCSSQCMMYRHDLNLSEDYKCSFNANLVLMDQMNRNIIEEIGNLQKEIKKL